MIVPTSYTPTLPPLDPEPPVPNTVTDPLPPDVIVPASNTPKLSPPDPEELPVPNTVTVPLAPDVIVPRSSTPMLSLPDPEPPVPVRLTTPAPVAETVAPLLTVTPVVFPPPVPWARSVVPPVPPVMFAFAVMLTDAVRETAPAPVAVSVAESVILPVPIPIVVSTVMLPEEMVPDVKVTLFVPAPAPELSISIDPARSAFVLKLSVAPPPVTPPSATVPVAVQVSAPPESVSWYAGFVDPVLTTLRLSFVPRDTVRLLIPSQL